ncbi:ABC transporter ATP-binding protein [Bifidobacterium pseudolongum subsp. pseudolongum]|uniref:ABC transporter ATP-binding protein n=1 Tax=Bifidobacterium pseudolongum subsp. pseudolongum TaxID=31954 RepID=A0A4Q5A8C0_9BIFI|nr:ATP-binding cassette domain-containing protein [Bifidobacterium pseudolongum]RYQ19651.1 ABC transporter ATP-binding protein [Bifidobacterium pseudolongum subsp. pseudolongum]
MVDKRLFSLVPGVRGLVVGKIICLWIGLLADIALAGTVTVLVASLFPQTSVHGAMQSIGIAGPSGFMLIGVAALAIAVVRFLAHHFATRLGTEAAERVKLGLRSELYRKMLRLGPSYAQRARTSDVVQLTGEGVDQIQSFFELFLPQLGFAILAPLTLFAAIAPLNMPTAVVLLVCAPLIIVIVGAIAMTTAKTFKKYWGKYTDMGSVFLDNLQGLETLKTFDADARAAEQMDRNAEDFRVMTMRVLQIQLRSLTAMDMVAYGGAAAGIGTALWQYVHQGHTAFTSAASFLHVFNGPTLGVAAVLFVILVSVDFFLPLRQLGSYFHVAMNGMTSTKRIFALLDEPDRAYGDRQLPQSVLDVTARGLGFTYAGSDTPALRDVTLSMPARSLTAVVGESGSGKSTLAALIAGELEGYSGALRIGAVEMRDLSERALTSAVSIVGARSHLFAGTLRENLLMACPGALESELRDALARAHVLDMVDAHPQGLDMRIEQDATNLSGGQRQRVAVARALLHDAPIMIFDEATSSVDAESERLIMRTVHELAEHKTVILVTHRLADAVDADAIAVFDHGACAETGTHAELMAQGGQYATMFRAQASVEQVGQRARNCGIAYAPAPNAVEHNVKQPGNAPSKRAPMTTFQLVRRLLGQVGDLRSLMVLACCFGTLGHLAATFLPVFGVMALCAAAERPVWGLSVGWAVALMVVCALIRGAMRYCEQYMNHNLAFRLLALFRGQMFAALRRLAPAKLTGKGKGDLISMVTTDVELLEIFFAHTISPTVIALATTVVYALALLFLSPWFAVLLVVAHLLIGVAVPAWFARALHGVGARIRKQSASLDDDVLDDMRGLEQIIRFGQGRARLARIDRRSRALWGQRVELSERNGVFGGFDHVIIVLVTVCAALLAVLASRDDMAMAARNVTAMVLVVSSFGPTLALSALPASLTQTFASARRLFALMDEEPAVEELGTLEPEYNGMRMEQVTFAYGARTPVLRNMTLDVPVSGILGLQGPSGRGKSTLLKLLMRYWDPQQGAVTMSGDALPGVDARARRRLQTMMSQETYLFDGTIASNLRIADAQTGDDELREALRKASILPLVESLPQGIETPVGELGGRLSEGERQRIGLARMFLRHADLYLFDEPTSRLDALNEAYILQSINELVSERDAAVVLVSHRASTMKIADEVLHM